MFHLQAKIDLESRAIVRRPRERCARKILAIQFSCLSLFLEDRVFSAEVMSRTRNVRFILDTCVSEPQLITPEELYPILHTYTFPSLCERCCQEFDIDVAQNYAADGLEAALFRVRSKECFSKQNFNKQLTLHFGRPNTK